MKDEFVVKGAGRVGRNPIIAWVTTERMLELHVFPEGIFLDTPWGGYRFRHDEITDIQWSYAPKWLRRILPGAGCRIFHSKSDYPRWISFGWWSAQEMADLRRHMEEFGYPVSDKE